MRARFESSQPCSAFARVVVRSAAIIWLIVSLRSAISPRAATVICGDKSPLATAVDTAEIARSWVVRVDASWLTFSVRSRHVPATPCTSACPPSVPSVPTSRATRVTSSAKLDSWSTIVLTVSLSSRISPRASTVIFWLRSPRATAVVTWAMLRTWSVRLRASWLTFSVRSRQVPDTPRTSACPPSRPSVPTSRATRVTSSANDRSCSTIVLTVSLSSRISPRASTVIFWLRSPRATAVVTCAMLRTWPVRLLAIELTLSVRSRQVPATPRTCACPPRFPSVPTSRATRVTSSAKLDSWSTIVLTVLFSSRISPRASTVIFWLRSPCATAVATCAMLRTWPVRLLAIELTLSVRSRHVPLTPRTCACPPRRPAVPTSRATRVTSSANDESWSTIVFTVDASSRTSPRASTVIFWVRSPVATAVATWAIPRTCAVRFAAMRFTASVRSFQVPATFGTAACPPRRPSVPTSRATRVTSSANRRSVSVSALIVSASSATSPRALTVILRERSP